MKTHKTRDRQFRVTYNNEQSVIEHLT